MIDSNKKEQLFLEERQKEILKLIALNKKVLVRELCNVFAVSSATIRTDLAFLESKNLIKRTHGGAIVNPKLKEEPLPFQNEIKMINEKRQIGLAANELVEDGDTIAISTGTTTFEFAKTLLNKKNLTVIINDVNVACFLENNTNFNIFLIGGMIRNNFHYIQIHDNLFPSLFIDKFFFTCNSFDFKRGATIPDISLANNIKILMSKAQKIVFLCDSSKFDTISFAQIATIDEIDTIVVDSKITKEHQKYIEDNSSLNLIIAKNRQVMYKKRNV